VIAYTGALAPEAIEATGFIGESRRDVGLLAITSAGRLHAGWTRGREACGATAAAPGISAISKSCWRRCPRECGIVTVIDGHPACVGLARPACVATASRRSASSTFGQTGTIPDLYRHHGIDANAIIDAAESLTAGAPVRHRKMAV